QTGKGAFFEVLLMPLIEVRDLKKYYSSGLINKQYSRAVDGVSFHINRGETLGLVGESGCGKTTVGRLLLRLVEPTSGRITFDGTDIIGLKKGEMRKLRPRMQMIFQDPESSLNPRMRIGESISEPFRLKLRGEMSRGEMKERVLELVDMVGLNPEHVNRFPHQLSGGQNQRVVLARILAIKPEFIVADEPTASLDVSVQAQILRLMMDLKSEFGLTMLFISHDMDVMRHMSDRIAVMEKGKIISTIDN
ncbi:dipeptide/oligopeptide/nickel ABC transporter ATP-binding protein, partial [Methanothrix sp.]|uniref:dipeptide/oligopeptide/nickel ABC transporter ATP-binding protein n=2 Tax=Methanothrix sp. TaxID=90426 RepID=UPI00316AE7A8